MTTTFPLQDMNDCWNRIGVAGDQSCEKLTQFIHCRNCDVYASAAQGNLQRPVDAGYRRQWAEHFRQPLASGDKLDSSVLVFRIGREWLALPTTLFVSVAPQAKQHKLPHRNERGLAGIVNVGGTLYPCMALADLLGRRERRRGRDRPPHLRAPAAAAMGRPGLRAAGGGPARHRALCRRRRAHAGGHHQQGIDALSVGRHHAPGSAHRLPRCDADRLPTCENITMSQDQQGDLSQFSMRDLFRMEADSQTQILTEGLLAMERHQGDASAVEAMMRAAHSIKGAAAIVGLDVVVQLAHGMEDSFIAAQHGKLALTPNRVDVLLSGVDLILQFSRLDDAGADTWLGANATQIQTTLDAIAHIAFLPEPINLQAEAALLAPAPPSIAAATAGASAAEDMPAPARAPALAKNTQNFDRLLSLASESRINAHQMHPFIQNLQRFKRNQSSLFSLVEQLHEAIANSSDTSLKEKSLLALQKTHPLKQFVLEHIADVEAYERRVLAVSQGMVDEVLTLRMRPFRDGVQA